MAKLRKSSPAKAKTAAGKKPAKRTTPKAKAKVRARTVSKPRPQKVKLKVHRSRAPAAKATAKAKPKTATKPQAAAKPPKNLKKEQRLARLKAVAKKVLEKAQATQQAGAGAKPETAPARAQREAAPAKEGKKATRGLTAKETQTRHSCCPRIVFDLQVTGDDVEGIPTAPLVTHEPMVPSRARGSGYC